MLKLIFMPVLSSLPPLSLPSTKLFSSPATLLSWECCLPGLSGPPFTVLIIAFTWDGKWNNQLALNSPCYIVRYHAAVCFHHPVSACCSTDANSFFFFFLSTPTSSPPTLPFIPSCVFSPSIPPSHCFFSRRHVSTRSSLVPSSWLPLTHLTSLESHPHTVCRLYYTLSHSHSLTNTFFHFLLSLLFVLLSLWVFPAFLSFEMFGAGLA